MSSNKIKPTKMWAVSGLFPNKKDRFLYADTAYTRRDMIERHVSALGHDWNYHKKKGDRIERVIIKLLKDEKVSNTI